MPDTILDETSFHWILRRERMRTDRSSRPFLLLLLQHRASWLSNKSRDRMLLRKIIQALKHNTRQIDIIGWYKHQTTMGVIFTELGEDDLALKTIPQRVNTTLRAYLTPEQMATITMSSYLYPRQDPGDSDSPGSDSPYPTLIRNKPAWLLKRSMDIFGSLGLLMAFSPILAVVGIAIKLTSQGPIVFQQMRIGQYGKPFTFFKFRSMYQDADPSVHEQYIKAFITSGRNGKDNLATLKQGGMFKLNQDSRITPVGRFIRKTSIDELPQLLNVLMGHMSLVGPRPPLPYEVASYEDWHMRRLLEARPGITGLWQVKGRSHTTFEDMVRLDLKYIDEWTIWSDIKILLQTPRAVISGVGAR